MAIGRPKTKLVLSAEEHAQLSALAASRALPHALVARAKLVRWAAQGERPRCFFHGSLVGFAVARNWSSRSSRSATNWPFCVANVPAAPGFPSSIACFGSGFTGSGRDA
jgi:hypothetical protein